MADDNQIDVRVTATIDGLKAGLQEAGNSVKGFSDQVKGHSEESGNAFEILGERASGIRHIIEGLSDPVHGLYNDVKELGEAFLAAFAIEKIMEFGEEMAEVGAQAIHMSQELGMSTEQVTAFQYAAQAMGIGAESADMGLMRLERSAAQAAGGSKRMGEAYKNLGISVKDSNGHVKDAKTLLDEVADSFSKHADGPEKTALAMEIMGRAGAKMIPVLNEGRVALDKMTEEAEKAGVVLDKETAEGMEKTALKFHEMKAASEGVAISLFNALKPAIDAIVQGVIDATEWLNGMIQAMRQNYEEGGILRDVLDGLGAVLSALGVVASGLAQAMGFLAQNLDTLLPVMLAVGAYMAGPMVAAFVETTIKAIALSDAMTGLALAFSVDGIVGVLTTALGVFVDTCVAAASATWAFTAALLANPLTWIAVAIGAVAYGLIQLAEHTKSVGDAFAVMGDAADEVIQGIFGLVREAGAVIGTFSQIVTDAFTLNWAGIQADWNAGLDAIGNIAVQTANRIKGAFDDAKAHMDFGKGGEGGEKGFDIGVTGEWEEKPSYAPPKSGGGKKKKGKDVERQLADEELQAAEREALEAIKIEEDKNNTLLQLGQRGLDEYVAQQRQLENQKFSVISDFYTKKAAADAKDRVAHQKDLDEIKIAEMNHTEAMQRIDDAYQIKKAEMARKATEDYVKAQQEQLTDEIQQIDKRFTRDQLSFNQKIALELELTKTVQAEVLHRLDAELAGLDKGTKAYEDAMRKREEVARKFSKDTQKIQDEALDRETQKWKTFSGTISGGFNQALSGMVIGTTTWQKALGGIIDGIANAFLNMFEQVLAHFIETQILKVAVSKQTEAEAVKPSVMASAAKAAAGAYSAVASIPVVGPFLAPEAAAAAFAAVAAFDSLAFAEQGMLLDRDRLVYAHKDEQILPAHLSKGMQQIIANGGTGGGKGDANLHYSPTINAPESKPLSQLLREDSRAMVGWLNRQIRDGVLKVGR